MQKKSFLITEVLAMLLGFLGVHRYYTGYVGLGILQTLTFGGFGIWSLIDFIFISLGKYKDANGQELESYDKNLGLGFLIFFIVVTFALVRLPSNKTVINNTYSPNVSDKTERVERIVVFGDITCTVNADGYGCNGRLSDEDRAKLKIIQAELNTERVERIVVFGDIICTVNANGYDCNDVLSDEDRVKLKKIQAGLQN